VEAQIPPGRTPEPSGGAPSPAKSPSERKQGTPWGLIAIGVVAVYALIVALLNSEEVKVDFLFFSATVRLLFLIFLCLGAGFAVGFLFDRWRERKKRSQAA
jgi:uncharacterized integral membrane protein